MNSDEQSLNYIKNKKGFTLIEMLVYVCLLGVITIVIVGIFSLITRTNSRVVSLIEINTNAYSTMERMAYEISNAENVYFPTSNFTNYNYDVTKAMQFSIVTKQVTSGNENSAYMDFYLESNTIFMKQDGVDPIALTSKNVFVQSLNFYYYKNGGRESVKIDFSIKPNNILDTESNIDLSTVVALRS